MPLSALLSRTVKLSLHTPRDCAKSLYLLIADHLLSDAALNSFSWASKRSLCCRTRLRSSSLLTSNAFASDASFVGVAWSIELKSCTFKLAISSPAIPQEPASDFLLAHAVRSGGFQRPPEPALTALPVYLRVHIGCCIASCSWWRSAKDSLPFMWQ